MNKTSIISSLETKTIGRQKDLINQTIIILMNEKDKYHYKLANEIKRTSERSH